MMALLTQYRLLLITGGAAALMALSAAGAWQWQANACGRQIADMQRDHAQAQASAQAQARAEEQRRQTAIEGIRQHAQTQIAEAAADAIVADAAADGLRDELDRLKRRPAGNTCAAAGGEARPDATELLADLLAEVESAGRAMAAEAQRRGIAGEACERAYSSLSP